MTGLTWKESGTVTIDHCTLAYRCYGPQPTDSLTLVLLHEGLGCIELWRDFPDKLAQATGCGVLVYSRAGYGKSDPCTLPRQTDYMHREAMDVLPQILDYAGVKNCILVGHSDGASIAAIYAGTAQDFRVRAQVLIAPHFFAESISLSSIENAKQQYLEGDLRDKLAPYHSNVDCAFNGWCDVWLSEDFRQWNISEVIDYFRVPVLGIQGHDDQYGTMAQMQEIESRCYAPFEQLVLDDCKHSPHLQQTEQTVSAISSFTKRVISLEAI